MEFSSHSLNAHPHAGKIRAILSAALEAADPTSAIRAELTQHIDWITSARRVFLLSVGKAALRMAEAALPFLTDHLAGGLVVTKHASRVTTGLLPIYEADHPIPGARSLQAGQRVVELVSHLKADDLLVCLFSGGASALMTAPVDGISLADLQSLTATMLKSGASIDELNALRRRVDKLKGGGLAQLAAPACVLSLILSDVVGDRLEVIASGPTAPDPTKNTEIEAILSRYSLEKRFPVLSWGGMASRQNFDHVQNLLVGSNSLSLQAAQKQAERAGFRVRVLTTSLQGEARLVGRNLAQTLRAETSPTCLLAGGETTVTVTGDGKGGRNQELALAAALELDGLRDVMLISFATDGDDGTTGAAGAVVTGDTLTRARALGLNAQDFLHRNDSFSFFSALDDLIVTGPTGTNVNDLVLMFRFQSLS
jgi:hydroxypyruvate reductase